MLEILKDEKEEVEEFKGHYQMDAKARKKRTSGKKRNEGILYLNFLIR